MLGCEHRVAGPRQRLHEEGRLGIAAAVAMREKNYRPRPRGLAVGNPGVDYEPRDLKFLRNREVCAAASAQSTGATAAQHESKSVNPASLTQRTINILTAYAGAQRRSGAGPIQSRAWLTGADHCRDARASGRRKVGGRRVPYALTGA